MTDPSTIIRCPVEYRPLSAEQPLSRRADGGAYLARWNHGELCAAPVYSLTGAIDGASRTYRGPG